MAENMERDFAGEIAGRPHTHGRADRHGLCADPAAAAALARAEEKLSSAVQRVEELRQELKGVESRSGEFDKRLSEIEGRASLSDGRWKTAIDFLMQLIWVVIAAYVLTQLNLQSPAVP